MFNYCSACMTAAKRDEDFPDSSECCSAPLMNHTEFNRVLDDLEKDLNTDEGTETQILDKFTTMLSEIEDVAFQAGYANIDDVEDYQTRKHQDLVDFFIKHTGMHIEDI